MRNRFLLLIGLGVLLAGCRQQSAEAVPPKQPSSQILDLEARKAASPLPPIVYSVPKQDAAGNIAITIDMEGGRGLMRLLHYLKKHNAKATFFIAGEWGARHSKLISRISNEGHEIGNHTLGHRYLPGLPADKVRRQIQKLDDIVQQAAGRPSGPLFRPPYGATDHRVRRICQQMGYQTILWNVDTLDSLQPKPSSRIILRRLKRARSGSIILTHSTNPGTYEAIIRYLPIMNEWGLKPVTVSELLAQGKLAAAHREQRVAQSLSSRHTRRGSL